MRFVGKRLALFVAALVGLSALVFVMLRVLPGDVAAVIAGTNATPERIASLRAEFGLDKPLVAQYGDWMAGMLHGDLGVSAVGGRPVARQVAMPRRRNVPSDCAEPADRAGDRPAAWLRGRPDTQSAAARPVPRHCDRGRRGARIVGRPTADPAVLPWQGTVGIAARARLPRHRLGHAGKGPVLSAAAGAHHRHHSRRVHHALHACRSGGYGLIAGGGHGHGLPA